MNGRDPTSWWQTLATATLFPLVLAAQSPQPGALVQRQVQVMGTFLKLEVVAATRSEALHASEAALQAVLGVEARLSTWRSNSELEAFNRHPVGQEFPLSPQLASDLALAFRVWEMTGGAFDPAIGAVLRAWDVRGDGRRPTAGELEAARQASGMKHLRLTPHGAVRLHPEVRLEEGGFGKGVGLDAALAALVAAGAQGAVLNLGGQLAVLKSAAGHEVALAHPRQRSREVARLRVYAGSLATSGNGERPPGRPHLFDPRTGRPAKDFGSITVWAASAAKADALATGLFVLGPDEALEWARDHPAYAVLVVELTAGGVRLRPSQSLARGQLPVETTALSDGN